MLVKRKERISRNTRVHDIAAIVTSIVPALARFNRSRSTRRTVERRRRVRMASSAFPLPRILFFQFHRSSLIIVPLQSRLSNIFKRLLGNYQIGTEHLPTLLDGISSRNSQGGEIDKLHILTARIPAGCRFRSSLKYSLTGGIYNFDITRTFKKSKFLRICGTVANLVDIGSRSGRRRSKRKNRSCEGDILL